MGALFDSSRRVPHTPPLRVGILNLARLVAFITGDLSTEEGI